MIRNRPDKRMHESLPRDSGTGESLLAMKILRVEDVVNEPALSLTWNN